MNFPLMVQPKLDGIRCISQYDQTTGTIIMFSRKGTPFNNFTHISDELKEIVNTTTTNTLFIDGELYSPDLTFERISGLVRSQTITSEDSADLQKIQYHIYDIYVLNQPLLGYHERNQILNHFMATHARTPTLFCVLVDTKIANTIKDIPQYHQHYVEHGYEGIMLRDPIGPYEIDKRSKYLQKYKTFIEEEFRIVGIGEEDGMIMFVCETEEKRIFNVRPRGSFESRREMFKKGESYIGKLLTVIFQEYTELNVPRFGVGKAIRDYE
jgi:DNA ligase-1